MTDEKIINFETKLLKAAVTICVSKKQIEPDDAIKYQDLWMAATV
jgi:hypothetical protein